MPPRPLQKWEKGYQPWFNLVKAIGGMAPQAVTLGMVWWSVTEWNARSYEVVSYCDEADFYGYVCETTKAFARCFPLVGASTTLVVAGRFMLQRWLYYRMLLRGGLLDFDNYVIYTDPAFLLVALSFLCGLGHFAFSFYYDAPTKDQLARIFADYIPACCIYFVVFERFCNIENHLVTLPKFFEEDADWSKDHIHKSACFAEDAIRSTSRDARKAVEAESANGEYSIDQLLERIMKNTAHHQGTSHLTPRTARIQRTGLFNGLWPSRIVLDPRLTDPESMAFKRSFHVFSWLFLIVHVGLLFVLAVRIFQGYHSAYPPDGHIPVGSLHFDGYNDSFNLIGNGHCRGTSLRRPNFHYIRLEELDGADVSQVAGAPVEAELRKLRGGADRAPPKITARPVPIVHHRKERHSSRNAWRDGDSPHPRQELHWRAPSRQTALLLDSPSAKRATKHIQTLLGMHHLDSSIGHANNTTALIATSVPNYLKSTEAVVERTMQGCEDDARGYCVPCAVQCASNKDCIGFAIDPEFCTNYVAHEVPAPPGWTGRGHTGETEFDVTRIVRVKGGDDDSLFTSEARTSCWAKLNSNPEPQDIAGVVVFLIHFGLIAYIFQQSFGSFWSPEK